MNKCYHYLVDFFFNFVFTPIPNIELFRNSFIFSGTSIWNSIIEYINTASSVKHVKSLYLRWYKQYFES